MKDLEAAGDSGRNDAVHLAVSYGVACKWASMVAVESRPAAVADATAAVTAAGGRVTTTIGPCGMTKIAETPAVPIDMDMLFARSASPRTSNVRSYGSWKECVLSFCRWAITLLTPDCKLPLLLLLLL